MGENKSRLMNQYSVKNDNNIRLPKINDITSAIEGLNNSI